MSDGASSSPDTGPLLGSSEKSLKNDLKHVAAASLVMDALHGRENTIYNTNPQALRCKFLYHNRFYRDLVTLVSLCHVCLGIVEGRDNMYSTIKMDWWVETSFCVIYMIDSMIVLKFIGKERWLKQEVWIFVLSLLVRDRGLRSPVFIVFSLCFLLLTPPRQTPPYPQPQVLLDVMLVAADLSKLHYPVLRFLRPAFFAARRRHLKACFVSMFKSMFACLPLMLILSFSVIIFAVIGWIGFDSSKAPYNTLNHEEGHCSTANHGDGTNSTMPIGSCNDYFLTFSSSIYQVWILLVKVS